MNLTIHPDAGAFLAAAETPLMREEAKNNLILGIAGRVRARGRYDQEAPYFLSVTDGRELVAAAVRTPPYPLVLHCETDRLEALDLLIDRLRVSDPNLSGVNGESCAVAAFAERWVGRASVRAEVERNLRIYVLREVVPPVGVPGRMRSAEERDVGLLAEWICGFQREAAPSDPPTNPQQTVRRFIDSGMLAVWDDGGPVSMAGSSRGSENGAAVSAVYTPPERRRKGYASACVAALSQLLLDRGHAFCTLYTDLSNPTSNKIYQRIGYRPVADSIQYRFQPMESKAGAR